MVADVWRIENEGGGNANEVRACSKVNSCTCTKLSTCEGKGARCGML